VSIETLPAPHTPRIDRIWPRQRPVIMAIVNCTPDSFSDGGRYLDSRAAVRHGEQHIDCGADIIDVGGESTRPGAMAVDHETEIQRVVPVISGLRRRRPDTLISVDTSKAAVAAAAIEAGADIVNDVTAASDPRMLRLVAEHGACIVLMHKRGDPRTMQSDTRYDDVVSEVVGFLQERAAAAVAADIPAAKIWLDPGIGFGKDAPGNLELLASLPQLADLGHPVLIGPSRKSFIGLVTGAPLEDRLGGTLASLIPSIAIDRVVVRVHDPGPVRQFLEIAVRLHEARS
jgi:dihydropteroate synthase